MNERIRELAVKAGAEVLIGYDEIEAFAELIVRECANIQQSNAIASDILEHFGMNFEDEFGA